MTAGLSTPATRLCGRGGSGTPRVWTHTPAAAVRESAPPPLGPSVSGVLLPAQLAEPGLQTPAQGHASEATPFQGGRKQRG